MGNQVIDYISNFQGALSWKGIILHHSATPDGKVNDWEAIRRWHTGLVGSSDPKANNYNPYKANPDKDIGYHFGLEMIGGKLTYQIGRSLAMQGAHTIGMNSVAIGICLIGNYNKIEPTDQQYFLLASLCRELQRKFKILLKDINPHWAYADKTCPGRKFDMLKFRYNFVQLAP